MTQKELLRPDQVAERLNLSRDTVIDHLSPGGELAHLAIRLNARTIRVDPVELEAHIQSKKGAANETA